MREDAQVTRWSLSFPLFIAAVAVALGTLVPNLASAQSATSRIVGSYSIAYRIAQPTWDASSDHDQVFIKSFNPSTGAITGTSGPGDGVFWAFLMRGRVEGTSIVMNVTNSSGLSAETAVLTGTVNRGGTISGTFEQSDGTKGTWTMTPRPTVVAIAESGFSEQFVGHESSNVTWGVALRNESRKLDAYQVSVSVQFVTTSGKVVPLFNAPSFPSPITLIPSEQTVYLGSSALGLTGRVSIKSLLLTVTVGATKPKQYELPPVTGVKVDRSTGAVTGAMTNPYSQSISVHDYRPTYVIYNAKGRIIGGGSFGQIAEVDGSQMIESGGHAPISFGLDSIAPSVAPSSARVSVTPQG
jgi:hypothetical protein